MSVDSSELSAESLAGILRTFDDGDYQFEINGEPYESVQVNDFPGDAARPFRRGDS